VKQHTTTYARRTPLHAPANTVYKFAPRWMGYAMASHYSGLGQRVLQNHVAAGFIRSSNAVAPGSTRGRRLIDRESLDAFIEAGVGSKTELVMNANRGGVAL